MADQALMADAKRYFAWQSRLVLREAGRRVVEAGCGTGNFTQHLVASIQQGDRDAVIAVDQEPQCIEVLRKRLGDCKNLTTVVATVGFPEFRALRRYAPDTCVCLNVLEHIEDDAEALESLASILPAGGVVLIVPAFAALYDRSTATSTLPALQPAISHDAGGGGGTESPQSALHEQRGMGGLVAECAHPETRSSRLRKFVSSIGTWC